MKEKLEVAKSEDCTALQVEEEGKGTSDEVKSGQRGGGSAEAASDELLFRYIEAGGIPSILFHYIALLFSTTIC